MKYVNLLLFPLIRQRLQREYGVFQHSALILLWSFIASLVILAGAHASANSAPHSLSRSPDIVKLGDG
jgi:hypothetical protein